MCTISACPALAAESAPTAQTCPAGHWCSALYQPNWTPDVAPDAEGRVLHDFSYAGYRNGERPPAAPPGATFDVAAAYGADATGKVDATASIQSAIDAASAAGGGIVFFPAGIYRIDDMLNVAKSGVVLRGVGASSVLHFTKATGMTGKANITFAGTVAHSAPHDLVADAPSRTKEVLVADASDLKPGDDVSIGWTITPSFISDHGMTGVWTTFAGQYQNFFRRTVVSVDTTAQPNRVVLDIPIRYDAKTRDGAVLHKEAGYLAEVGLEHLGITNAVTWDQAWAEGRVHAVKMHGVKDAWALDVHSVPPPGKAATDHHLRSGGLYIEEAKRVSVLESSMENPQNRGGGTGNGYLFEVSRTSEVLIADTQGRNGRHNFIQNWGFGNSGTVLLRCVSTGSKVVELRNGVLTPLDGYSEHHHSLAMATLVDSCQLDDGFQSQNRGTTSDGAGHAGTQSVVWNATGTGKVISQQFGWGYVIGTNSTVQIDTSLSGMGSGTAPQDFVEGAGSGGSLFPSSLYEDQRARRLEN
jgi:hypothetical protein